MKTFLRRLEILNFLKGQHEPVETDVIIQHLLEAGYVDEGSVRKSLFRVVQRDLNFLLGEAFDEGEFDNAFGLSVTQGIRKSRLWKIDPYSELNYSFEKMPGYMALALSISQKHLKQVLPKSTQDVLQDIFTRANQKLIQQSQGVSPKHYQALTRSVEFFQRGQQLKPPEYDQEVLNQIYTAILKRKRIRIVYSRDDSDHDYDLHPYGVAIMLPKLYLIAKKTGDEDKGENAFRSFLLHKITSIEISPISNQVPEDFELRSYLEDGNMDVQIDFKDTKSYQLILDINASASRNLLTDLRESPIATDQTLIKLEQGGWQLQANVKRTVQLRNWLLSLGAAASIQQPELIKQDLLTYLDSLRAQYPSN